MNLHLWELIVIGVLVLLPLVSRSARTILVKTFRHPAVKSVIVRDKAGIHVEHNVRVRTQAHT